MSPIGDSFRKRILTFPSLVSCTTIDWYLAWPKEALSSVAKFYLEKMDNLKEKLDNLVKKYETPDFIKSDPIQFPRQFSNYQVL